MVIGQCDKFSIFFLFLLFMIKEKRQKNKGKGNIDDRKFFVVIVEWSGSWKIVNLCEKAHKQK